MTERRTCACDDLQVSIFNFQPFENEFGEFRLMSMRDKEWNEKVGGPLWTIAMRSSATLTECVPYV